MHSHSHSHSRCPIKGPGPMHSVVIGQIRSAWQTNSGFITTSVQVTMQSSSFKPCHSQPRILLKCQSVGFYPQHQNPPKS